MGNFKRKKSRRSVRCGLCTDARCGNTQKGTGNHARVGFSCATKSQRRKQAEAEAND